MSKNTVLNNLPEDEILWADTKRILGMPISFTKYRVDENRLYCKRGFLKVETDELLLYRIMDIRSSQTLGQRIFGVGTVVLFCTDKTSGVLELKNIQKPDQVRRFLSDLVERRRTETGVKGREIFGSANTLHSPDCDTDGDDIPDCDEN